MLVSMLYYCIAISFVFLSLSSMAFQKGVHDGIVWFCCLGMVLLHAAVYFRYSRGSVFLLSRQLKMKLEEAAAYAEEMEDKDRSDAGYKSTYERLSNLFSEKKPYLDGNLTIGDIAKTLYTNKLYISKSINIYTGRNFCQYVNYHRVKYSMELFRSDPHLKISQLAEMSGFHTVTSYSMAFRLFMNETPGEWCRRNRPVQG